MAHEHKHRIDWVATAAGALAAMSSAVLLSIFGAAGTLVGAALGSAIISVGSSLYGRGLARSQERMAALQWRVREPVGVAHVGSGGVATDVLVAPVRLDQRDDALDEPGDGSSMRLGLAHLPWKRVAVATAGLFAASIMAITAFELIAGQPVSSFTGGGDSGSRSSIGSVTGGSGNRNPDHDGPRSRPQEEGPAGVEVSPMGGVPSSEPTATPSPEPTATPSPEPSATPSPTEPVTSPSPTPTSEPMPTDLPELKP